MITFSSFDFVFRTIYFEAELCNKFAKLPYFVSQIVHGRGSKTQLELKNKIKADKSARHKI